VIRINKAGSLYIALTILIGFSAVNTGNNLVYIVTSALLSYMVVSGVFGKRNLYAVTTAVEYPDEIFAGTDVPVRVRVTNRRRFMPAFLIRISVGGSEVFFPFIGPAATLSGQAVLRFPARGRQTIREVVVSSVFPFNFFTRYRRLKAETDLVVFPKPLARPLHEIYDDRSGARGEKVSTRPGYDSDILAIRDYVSGDPPKYISWKSTAKTGVLKTKELSAIEARHVIIDLNHVDMRDPEYALSCLTHGIIRLTKSGVPVGLSMEGETLKPDVTPGHRIRLLTKLALYGQD
jgi:uncharacterized protein (DUF58 family)